MDYLTSADKQIVAYFQPYSATTTGHTTIRNIVRESLPESAVLVTFTGPGQMQNWLERTPQGPALLLVDFPDTGYRSHLRELRHHRMLKDVPFAYLDMFAPEQDSDPAPSFDYDVRLALDPYSPDDGRPMARRWVEIGPVLLNDRLVLENPSPQANKSTLDQCLVCQTGTASERDNLTLYASRHRVNKDYELILSRGIKKADLLVTAMISKEIWAAGGYSMTWELAAYVPLSRVKWMLLDRPSEDCARRILRAMKLQDNQEPLLFREDRMLLKNKLRLTSVLRELIVP